MKTNDPKDGANIARQILKDEGYTVSESTPDQSAGGNQAAPAGGGDDVEEILKRAKPGSAAPNATNSITAPATTPTATEAVQPPAAEGSQAPDAGSEEGKPAPATEAGAGEGEGDGNAAPAKAADEEGKPATTEEAKPVKIDDATLLAELKKKGFDINSLEDLKAAAPTPTSEEIAKRESEEREQAIQFGLRNDMFKSTDLSAYDRDRERDPRELALEVFANVVRRDNPEMSDDDVEENFRDYFAEDLEDGSFRKDMMAREMRRLADLNISNKYAGIVNSLDAYRTANQIEQAATNYRSEVEQAFAEYPASLSFTIDGHTHSYKPQTDTLREVKEHFLSSAQFGAFGQEVPSKEILKMAIDNSILAKDHTRMIAAIAKAHADTLLLADKAGRKGIMPARNSDGNTQDTVMSLDAHVQGVLNDAKNS